MGITKTSMTMSFVLILLISFCNYSILARPEIKPESYECTVPCTAVYGNRECYNYCTSHKYNGGQCDATKGGELPQCCCYNYIN
ncbi:hypothetical protein BRARA_C04074 [Brassica rapa]|uniref:Defensin-like domain-containing protein n=1 Tax=Brassica campestris TaxID=3711 RepID=A0A398A2Y6_BRACM|nr:hypothetical protein BRARA_C04074 [Brassica rapa]